MQNICGKDMVRVIRYIRDEMVSNREELIRLDSEMGDGDLGIYMAAGMEKAYDAVLDLKEQDPSSVLMTAGMTMMLEAPSTMGTLLGSAFRQAGRDLKGLGQLSAPEYLQMFTSFTEAVQKRGGARLGDKTVLDVLIPAREAIRNQIEAGITDLRKLSSAAYDAAEEGKEKSKMLKAVYGRPAYFGEKTIGKYDGGTVVGTLICKAFCEALHDEE